jgi:hypothetical protein
LSKAIVVTEDSLPDAESASFMLKGALAQIDFSRRYTRELLDATPREHWFTQPAGAPTHIAWQVGHLAVSQYGLLMFRIHGRRDSDLDLIPSKFRKSFARGSSPASESITQMTAEQLVEKFDEVYRQAISGLQGLDVNVLLEPVDMPYAGYPTKLGAILFCPLHEQIHAGQIGLIRRLLGLPSVR